MKRHRRHIVVGVLAPDVPYDIQVGAGNKVFLAGHATGVQIYSCNGAGAWTLVAPRADLYGDNGKLIATHFGGPTWQAKDGSRVVASRDGGAMVEATAIPWLRLKASPMSSGDDDGRLAGTTYIQRVATVGGLPPASSTCTANTAGHVEEIPYTADYYFWKATG